MNNASTSGSNTHEVADGPDDRVARHPIRVVARRTGLSPAVLRAWERRYQVVAPSRSEGGQRLYSDDDVQRLALISQALEAGRTISHVASLSSEELRRLIDEDAQSRPPAPPQTTPAAPSPTATSILDASLVAVEEMNTAALEKQLMRGTILLSPSALIDEVVLPLLTRIGLLWEHGAMGPATEHVASVVVRRFLDWLRGAIEVDEDAPVLVCTTPAGHRHEFGALIAAVVAAQAGWRSTYLGPDLPAEEIASTVRRLGGDAVALSAVFPFDDPQLSAQVVRLKSLLSPGTPVFVGGRAAMRNGAELVDGGATLIERLPDLRRHLRNGAQLHVPSP